jgi:hypothetical protein
MLNVLLLEGVLSRHREELHVLQPAQPRGVGAHLVGEQGFKKEHTLQGEVHRLGACHAHGLVGVRQPTRPALLELWVQWRDADIEWPVAVPVQGSDYRLRVGRDITAATHIAVSSSSSCSCSSSSSSSSSSERREGEWQAERTSL